MANYESLLVRLDEQMIELQSLRDMLDAKNQEGHDLENEITLLDNIMLNLSVTQMDTVNESAENDEDSENGEDEFEDGDFENQGDDSDLGSYDD